VLSKVPRGKGVVGSWAKGKVFGTYLHGMFRGSLNPLASTTP